MSVYGETDRAGAAGVAYAQAVACGAELIWREFTGKDIGIDGLIELAPTRNGGQDPIGCIFVQVKCRQHKLPQSSFSIRGLSERRKYWLRQRLPLLLCVVERDRFVGKRALWVHFEKVSERCTGDSIDLRSLKHDTRDAPLWHTNAIAGSRQFIAFHDWIRSIIVSPAEAVVSQALREAERHTDAGHTSEAIKRLNALSANVVDLVPPERGTDLKLSIAKAQRRSGLLNPALKLLSSVQRDRSSRKQSILDYEIGFVRLLCAYNGSSADWTAALRHFSLSGRSTSEHNAGRTRDRLIATSATVLAITMRSLVLPPARSASYAQLQRLHNLLDLWDRRRRSVSRLEHSRRAVNGRMALWRAYLQKGQSSDLAMADKEKRRVEDLIGRPDGHCTPHTVAHYLLLSAWHERMRGRHAVARALLDAVRRTARRLLKEPELAFYLQRIERIVLQPE